jgi:hypothetical protein
VKLWFRAATVVTIAIAATVYVPAAASALTTGHSGSGRPGVAVSGASNRLYLGWTGSTSYPTGYELDLGWSTDGGKTITKIAQSERVPQGEGPALSSDGTGVYIGWSAANNGDTLTASYFDGTTLSCRTAFTGVTTPYAPAMVTAPTGVRSIAWTDPSGHLNVAQLNSSACSTTHTMTLTNHITLPDTSIEGPAMVYDSSGSSNLGTLIAWNNATHVVTVATYNGTTTLTGRSAVPSPVDVVGGVGLGVSDSDLYISFTGSDGLVYQGYSEGRIPTDFNLQPYASAQGTSGVGLANGMNNYWGAFFDQNAHLVVDPI